MVTEINFELLVDESVPFAISAGSKLIETYIRSEFGILGLKREVLQGRGERAGGKRRKKVEGFPSEMLTRYLHHALALVVKI